MILLLFLAQLDSLSIQKAIDIALEKSPVYHESRVSLEKSRIQFYESLANLLPTLSVTGTYTKSEYQGFRSGFYTGELQLIMPIFDLDIISSIFVSRSQLVGDNIQHQSDISNLVLRIKTAYYNLINAYELTRSAEIAIERARENSKLVETKYELGSASRLELLQGEVFYLRAEQDKSQARTLEISAQEELKSILGGAHDIYPTDTLIAPAAYVLPDIDSLTHVLHKVNYNIRIAQEYRDIARINLLASYLAFLPRISLFYGYNVSSDSLIFDFEYYLDNATKNYGVSIAFPIFEIKSLIFRYLNAKKDHEMSKYTQERVMLESENALRTTYFSLREALAKIDLARKSLDAAEEATIIAREQYALGLVSFLDLLAAEKAIYDARVSYTSALSDYYQQGAKFSYLLGNAVVNKEQ